MGAVNTLTRVSGKSTIRLINEAVDSPSMSSIVGSQATRTMWADAVANTIQLGGGTKPGGSNASGCSVMVNGGTADGTGVGGPVMINGGNSADAVGASAAGAVSLVTQNTGAFTHPVDSGAILITTGDANQNSGPANKF